MAKNESRSMSAELHQGLVDGLYMQLHPNWGGPVSNPPTERYSWPTYARVEQHTTQNVQQVPRVEAKITSVGRHQPSSAWDLIGD